MKVIFLSKVKLNYPSKTYTRKVEDECDASIVRNIVDGTSTGVANAVWASEQLNSCLLKKVEKNIQDECSSLCSKKSPSILANTSPTHPCPMLSTRFYRKKQRFYSTDLFYLAKREFFERSAKESFLSAICISLTTVRNISRYSWTRVEACLFDRFVLFGE